MKTLPILLLLLSSFIGYSFAVTCVTIYEKPEGFVWWFEPTGGVKRETSYNVDYETCRREILKSPTVGSGLFVRDSWQAKKGYCEKYPMNKITTTSSEIRVNFAKERIAQFIVKYDGTGKCDMNDLDKRMDGVYRTVPGSNPPRKLALYKDPTYYNIILKWQ
ncbi:unnamed protein product [Caenorhabditis brenneri]